MKTRGVHVLAIVLTGLGWTIVSGAAHAGGSTAIRYAEMREACVEQGGSFEQSWRYNDQGVRWGEVLTCSTSVGSVTCQDNVCRSDHWGRANDMAQAGSGRVHNGEGMEFPTDSAAFANAVASLAVR